jgi:anti-sigma factor RsiW
MREHPAEGELQALLDGELPHARVLVVRAHLLRCATCRARANAARETAAMVNALLRRTTPKVDSASAWERLVVRSAGRAAKPAQRLTRRTSVAVVALAAAALIVMTARGVSVPRAKADAFALVREAQAHPASSLLRDACCSDHDGGDRADDGLLTLSSLGEKVTVVVVYEDVDHSGTFTHGDIVRYVSTIPHGAAVAHNTR